MTRVGIPSMLCANEVLAMIRVREEAVTRCFQKLPKIGGGDFATLLKVCNVFQARGGELEKS